MNRDKSDGRGKKVSLYPLQFEEAVKGFLRVKPNKNRKQATQPTTKVKTS